MAGTKYARVTPYWVTSSVKGGSRSGTRKFWTTTPRINKRLREALVVEKRTKSALYIAKERNSFATLYREISRTILKPALEKLPKEDVVREMIQHGLEEYREEE